MATKSQWVEVGKRSLELSNLEKLLFPDDEISKAEVIEYYLKVSPVLLDHIKGRPLTLIRYPDGIKGQKFYQKNTPEWAPEWIESVSLGSEEKKDYVLATERASLIWLANLAALELHQMHRRSPNFDQPDYMVFDLDPSEDGDFKDVVDIAFRLKEHVEQYGYHTFVKTTGGKGLHLVTPLLPEKEVQEVFEAAKEIAQSFVQKFPDELTLQIKKDARKGRMLIDIYRNRSSQTIVSPYSLRGRAGAPVSMPVSWEELPEIDHSSQYHLRNAWEKIEIEGDAWEGIGGYAVHLHTIRAKEDEKPLPDSPYRKTPAQLAEYEKKRDFSKTREPGNETGAGEGNRFVVHRHHATRLHYDLRLEEDGVLKSWAVPKGMPHRPGVKRLAVQTEDHPLKYLTFEGSIPKNEYGGGEMWIYATGKYTITKKKKDGLYFRLESTGFTGEYRMHRTRDREWLLEKVDPPKKNWLNDPVEPMQGESVIVPPKGDYLYEVKWDGIRALITLEEGNIRLHSRNQNDITDKFPELQEIPDAFRAANGLFDGEIVSLDESGKPSFEGVINRLKSSGETTIQKLSKSRPVYCYVFDCLYLDGRSLVNEPFYRRYEWLADSIKKGSRYRLSEVMEDGEALYKAAQQHHLEGIMAKKRDSKYFTGRRSSLWQKVKIRHTVDCLIIGYTKGKGGRSGQFGALHLAEIPDQTGGGHGGELIYRGKMGTGFNEQSMKKIYNELQELETTKKPSLKNIPDDKNTTWVEPELHVEVSYGRLSANGLFKEAVFVRLRPDLVL
ncbi:MAG: non-homologous end-joining DNA ligase [Balneolaceae bacterium]